MLTAPWCAECNHTKISVEDVITEQRDWPALREVFLLILLDERQRYSIVRQPKAAGGHDCTERLLRIHQVICRHG